MPRWRGVIQWAAAATAILLGAVGAATVRADLEDFRLMAAAHTVLLEEAEAVVASVTSGPPVAVVRDEQTSPLHEVVAEPAGLPKLVFVRNLDPYGLIDTAALFEWVLADETTAVKHVTDWDTSGAGTEGVVMAHRDGGFVNLGTTPDLAGEARRLRERGRGVQVVRPVSLN